MDKRIQEISHGEMWSNASGSLLANNGIPKKTWNAAGNLANNSMSQRAWNATGDATTDPTTVDPTATTAPTTTTSATATTTCGCASKKHMALTGCIAIGIVVGIVGTYLAMKD